MDHSVNHPTGIVANSAFSSFLISEKYEEGLEILFREYNNDFISLAAENAFGWKNYGRFAKFRDKFIELNYLKEEYRGNRPRYSFLETDREKLLNILKSI